MIYERAKPIIFIFSSIELNEELALASSIRDFSESPLDLHDEELTDDVVVYNLKYLGSSPLLSQPEESSKKIKFTKKTNLATTCAIKKIIAASKNQKKLTEVSISISPKGIDATNTITEEPILHIPIYKISYCSVDAAHDTIFSFVSSTADNEENFETKQFGSPDSPVGQLESSSSSLDDEDLVLHAFQCQKRKIAHTVTLSVARYDNELNCILIKLINLIQYIYFFNFVDHSNAHSRFIKTNNF
jgi:low density lipoprotein receptor adapter protein 1